MQTHIHREIARGNIVSVCFLDVSAGFDTVPHSYLLRKLQLIGYAGNMLKWVKSYLTGRTTRVKIETRMSRPVITRKGVPQGGTGSPGFWREYTLDMIMTLHESEDWERYDKLDREGVDKLNETEDQGYWEDELCREMVLRWDSLDAEEKHDLAIVKQGSYTQLTKYTGRE